MKKICLLLFLASHLAVAQAVEVIQFDDLQKILQKPTETTYIINFWATWCKPCVAELPHFETLNKNHSQNNIKILLVSLDFLKDLEKVQEFVKSEKLMSEVVLLNQSNANDWINLVDTSWSGAIPATLMLNQQKKDFFERDFSYESLSKTVQEFCNK